VVGTLEFAGIPLTGASLWTLAACRRKPISNALLQQAGLPIPRWTVAQGKIEDDFPLPAIVKPAAEDASAGLDRGSVVSDRKSLRARLAAMTEQFDEVFVQEYIGGREFNVGFVGNRVLPIAEIDFSRMPEGAWPILTYAGKWELGSADDLGSAPVCPAGIPQKLADRLVRVAELAWRTMQGKGYGRVDLRVDDQGRPWVLEGNPNPDLNDDAGLSRMAKVAGWDYAVLVRRIAEVALREAQGAKAARELLAPSRRPRAARTAWAAHGGHRSVPAGRGRHCRGAARRRARGRRRLSLPRCVRGRSAHRLRLLGPHTRYHRDLRPLLDRRRSRAAGHRIGHRAPEGGRGEAHDGQRTTD